MSPAIASLARLPSSLRDQFGAWRREFGAPWVAIFAFLFLGTLSAWVSISVFQICYALAIVTAIGDGLRRGTLVRTLRDPFVLSIVLYCAAGVAGSVLTGHDANRRHYLANGFFALVLAVPLVFDPAPRRALGQALLAALVPALVVGGWYWSGVSILHYLEDGNASGPWGIIFNTGSLLTFSIFAAGAWAFRQRHWAVRAFCGVSIPVFLAVIWLTKRRSMLLALILGVCAVFYALWARRIVPRKFLLALFLALLAGFLATALSVRGYRGPNRVIESIGLYATPARWSFDQMNNDSAERLRIGRLSVQVIEKTAAAGEWERFLVGWGRGSDKHYAAKFELNYLMNWSGNKTWESVLPLSEFMHGGLVGLAAVGLFFFLTCRLVWRGMASPASAAWFLLLAGIFASLGDRLFRDFLMAVYAVGFCLTGLMLAALLDPPGKGASDTPGTATGE
ncbi:MAG: hypothetical protein J0L75_21505 [Spirochaetes bacterium]|nr:hypothetical protein [Spirochaetota bacterium]